ncbi:MAG: DNA replication and repair protein RecF [Acidobacteriota bacterium]
MLVRLSARRFRNLEPFDLDLEPGCHLVLGPNGAGKTSLLEAIYVLATTRSFRTPRLADCVRRGAEGFVLRGETARRAALEVVQHAGGRERRLGGDRVGSSEYLAALPVVAWTATDVDLPTGPPAERRRFLDRGIVAERPASLDVVARYRRALDAKRGLLAGGRAGAAELASWNQVLAAVGAEYATRRAAYVERLRAAFAEVLEVCVLELPPIALDYRPSPRESLDGAEALFAAFEAAAPREAATEYPLLGPQRDELSIRWDGLPVKQVASAGERKALGLALLAAHGRILEQAGRVPVYLLDDVDTELDRERLAGLWRHFGAARQLFATSNRPAVWDELGVTRRWSCRTGRLTPEAA